MDRVHFALQNLGALYHSVTFSYFLKGIVIYIAALWIALIVWVTRDVINRSDNLILQIFVISLNIILPVFGLIIYLIIRPTETLIEKYYQDLEYKMLTESEGNKPHCRQCNVIIDKEYLFCPECGVQVKKKCTKCHNPYFIEWSICPYCGVKSGTPIKRKSRR